MDEMTGLERLIFFAWLLQGTLFQDAVDGTNCTASHKPTVSVQASSTVREGQNIALTCNSDAKPLPTFTWYTVRRSLVGIVGSSRELKITIMADDTKFYCEANNTCGSQKSGVTQINVLYAPKTTSVSVSPSGSVMEGTLVTLSCSSNANPPVNNFTWYTVKGEQKTRLGVGKEIKIYVSMEVRQFYCEAMNDLGEKKSPHTEVDVLYLPRDPVVSVSPSGPVPEGSPVNLTCRSDANPPVTNYIWYSEDESHAPSEIGSEQNLMLASANEGKNYYCQAANQYGSDRSKGFLLNIIYPPKNTSVSVARSSSTSKDVSVILTCSSEAKPPVERYTWFRVRGGVEKSVGVGQNLTCHVDDIIDGGEYYCKAQNQHGVDTSTPTEVSIEFAPLIRPSSGCIRSKSQLICTCESHGNPAPSVKWSMSGQHVENSLHTSVREESLGRTGLRSSLIVRLSEKDTPTPLCSSVNSHGSTSLQFCVASTGYQMLSVLIGVGAGAAGMLLLGVLMFLIARRMHTKTTWDLKKEDKTDLILTDWTLSQEEDSLYISKDTLAGNPTRQGAPLSRPQQPNGGANGNGGINNDLGSDHYGPPMDATNCYHRPLPHPLDLPPRDKEAGDKEGE
ncbi:carcinoembryonic antigen-related cell adhesion molecule 5 isoform X1 [Esox lucius]|uniref:Ig-like domain-containing protein n=2 Tax=Esox lucius TaxID=8010 RepID=A0AAY5KA52_ESOLU|nr:carcinoembryonic antigen-related cell adhesion molecule 5 isoform X1 [Esox lucius]